jgi:hypothetical protein
MDLVNPAQGQGEYTLRVGRKKWSAGVKEHPLQALEAFVNTETERRAALLAALREAGVGPETVMNDDRLKTIQGWWNSDDPQNRAWAVLMWALTKRKGT